MLNNASIHFPGSQPNLSRPHISYEWPRHGYQRHSFFSQRSIDWSTLRHLGSEILPLNNSIFHMCPNSTYDNKHVVVFCNDLNQWCFCSDFFSRVCLCGRRNNSGRKISCIWLSVGDFCC